MPFIKICSCWNAVAPRKYLILSADHIYRMDYAALIKYHEEKTANLTVACMTLPVAEAHDFGVMSIRSR